MPKSKRATAIRQYRRETARMMGRSHPFLSAMEVMRGPKPIISSAEEPPRIHIPARHGKSLVTAQYGSPTLFED